MRSIKKKLLLTILGVAFGFSLIIFGVILSQLIIQRNTISDKGQREAKMLSTETEKMLGDLNQQVAQDFSGSSTKYFNNIFKNIRKHVNSISDELKDFYKENRNYGDLDSRVGIIEGVSKNKVEREFGVISPIRDFIKNLPQYNGEDVRSLDLYVVTESGMCLDGTGETLGNDYADLRKENWYQNVKKYGKVYWSGVFTGKVSKKVKVICAQPVYDAAGKFMGCVAGDMAVEAFQDIIEEFDEEQIKSVIFFDSSDELMYATNEYKKSDEAKKYLGKKKIIDMGDEIYSYSTLNETGWKICLVLDQEKMQDATQKIQKSIVKNANGITDIVQKSIQKSIVFFLISIAIGAVCVVIVTTFVAGSFVEPIRQLMQQVKVVGSGDLSHEIEVKSKDEIGQLADSFNMMTTELREYMDNVQRMTVDKERMTAELNVAKQIQLNMLPTEFPAFPNRRDFDIYATVHPVDVGGGNFYDFFMADKTHFCMVIGDVSGTGIPTTLFAVITKTHIKNYAQLGYHPERILAETNNQMSYKNDAGLTASVFVGIVDLQVGTMEYVNAGQMAPLWKHSGKDFEFLRAKSCFALGSMENVPYWKQSIILTQGDMIYMHTQGVASTVDRKDNEYTQEYLYEVLNALVKHEYELSDILNSIEEDLERFADGVQQPKDRTMLAFRFFGK